MTVLPGRDADDTIRGMGVEIIVENSDDLAASVEIAAGVQPPVQALVIEELLIEEISIDGMCGVY